MIALFLIALIIDTMISHTFPAYTLIAGIIAITVNSCKNLITQEDNKITKIQNEVITKKFEDIYNETEPLLSHLTDEEKSLLKRFIDENKKCIEISQEEYKTVTHLFSNSIVFLQIEPHLRINDTFYLLKVSQLHFNILKKYFETK